MPGDSLGAETDEPGASQLFNAIDHGHYDNRALVRAEEACASCEQLVHCSDQATSLATELWHRGAGLTIIGGTAVQLALTQRPPTQERQAFTFDLTKIPTEPDAAVAIIRQGFRARQFNAAGPTPKGVVGAGEQYLERLAEQQPELAAKLETLGVQETQRSLKYIFTALFQQKDFAYFSQGKEQQTRSGNARYDPANLTHEVDDPIVQHFLKDVIAIHDQGFSKPSGKAAHFEPDYYMALIKHHKPDHMNWSDFDRLIGTHRNPIEVLTKDQALASSAHALSPEAARTTIRAIVRHGSKERLSQEDLDTLCEHYSHIDFVTPALVKSIVNSNVGAPAVALESVVQRVAILQETYGPDHPRVKTADLILFTRTYQSTEDASKAVVQFDANMKALAERYGGDPDVSPSDIRRFSTSYLYSAEKEIKAYKFRLEQLRATSDSRIADSTLRQCARRGITSPVETAKVYDRRIIHDRFAYRAKKDTRARALRPELVERIVCLYPHAEIDQASEHAYKLINSGLLKFVAAETYSLRGQSREDLDKIFAPKTHEYLAFSASFRSLSSMDRLAFAHHYGLMPLLYGREANALQLEHLALSGKSIGEYFSNEVQPRLDELSADTAQTLSIMELERDLETFDTLLGQAPHRPLVIDTERLSVMGLRDATVVVGGKALYLHEPEYTWDWIQNTPDLRDWLEGTIAKIYPPHQQDQALNYIAQALDGGVLELLGETPGEYRLVFTPAFYENSTSDLDRAAIANAMGLDRLLYGSDLTVVLKHRLGNTPTVTPLHRHEKPEIIEFDGEYLAAARQELEYEALQLDSRQPLEQFVVTTLGDANTDSLTPEQWKRIGNDLLSAYNMHLEHPNHRHEVQDELTRAEVALAWTHARGGDVRAMARLFSVEVEDLDTYITAGTAYIREQFGLIPASRLKLTARLLQKPSHSGPKAEEQSNTLGRVRPTIDGAPPEYGSRLQGYKGERVVIIPSEQTKTYFEVSALNAYLKAVRNVSSRLPYEKEVAAFKEIEAGVLAQAKLNETTEDGMTPIDKADYQRLVVLGERAREEIITSFLPLVVAMAKRYPYRAGLDFSDYIQEGNIGLMHAVEKYDYTPGFQFSTYASTWINRSMRRAFNTHGRTIRVPDNTADNIQAYHAYSFDFMEQHQRYPTQSELIHHFGWNAYELESVKIGVDQRPASLQSPANTRNPDGQTIGELIWDTSHIQPDQQIDSNETRAAFSTVVHSALATAGHIKPALVMTLRHGLDLHPDAIDIDFVSHHAIESGKVYSTAEIAAMLHVTESAVTYHHRRAVTILNEPANRRRLRYLLGHTDSPS